MPFPWIECIIKKGVGESGNGSADVFESGFTVGYSRPLFRFLGIESLERRVLLAGDVAIAEALSVDNNEVAPDFALLDTNETSPTFGQSVSPRDYQHQLSAWYFGHAP